MQKAHATLSTVSSYNSLISSISLSIFFVPKAEGVFLFFFLLSLARVFSITFIFLEEQLLCLLTKSCYVLFLNSFISDFIFHLYWHWQVTRKIKTSFRLYSFLSKQFIPLLLFFDLFCCLFSGCLSNVFFFLFTLIS